MSERQPGPASGGGGTGDDWPTIEILRERVAAGRAAFDRDAGRESILIEDPTARQLPDGPLHYVWSQWRERAGGGPPAWSDFEPRSLLPRLHEVMLVEVIEAGTDVRYRLHGSRVSDTHGFDLTGQRLSESDYAPSIKQFFTALYAFSACSGLPVHVRHGAPAEIPSTGFDRLVLPLAPRREGQREALVIAQAWEVRPGFAWRGLSLVRRPDKPV